MVINVLLILDDPLEALNDPNLRAGAIRQVGEFRNPRAIDALIDLAAGDDPTCAVLAIDALARIAEVLERDSPEHARIIACLRQALEGWRGGWKRRTHAHAALTALGCEPPAPRLLGHLLLGLARRPLGWVLLALVLALLAAIVQAIFHGP
jgi:HEAT repeat protein